MEKEKKTDQILYRFRGAGLLGLCLLLFFSGIYYLGGEKETGSIPASARIRDEKFPICRVDTQQPKVSFSFDAACGGGR
ncbi:MAG: hypothetical protein Q4B90_06855 [Eubacteriales bacterium]|nr:hypothetical protein [Eubacteriales bacterium]